MTIQAVPAFLYPAWGLAAGSWGTSPTYNASATATLDAANEAAAAVFTCPVSGSLTAISIRTQTVSITSGPLNFDCRLETVSNGRPTGTLFGTNTNAAWSVANTDDNVWKENTLTAAATVVAGDNMAVVVKAPGSGTFSFTWGGFSLALPLQGTFPVFVTDVSGTPDGTYETNVSSVAPSLALKVDGVFYRIPPWMPLDSITAAAYNSGSASDEYALRILLPVSVRVVGAAVGMADTAAGADFTVSLWPDSGGSQTDGDALAQKTLDGDSMGGATADGMLHVTFPAPVTLAANTVYWLGLRSDTGNNINRVGFTVTSASYMAAMPCGTDGYQGARAWSAGSAPAFTTTTTAPPVFSLLLNGIDVSTGGLPAIGNAG